MNGGSKNPIAQVERTERSVLVNADPDGEFGTNTACAPTSLIPGPITAQRILDKPEREEDLGSGTGHKLQALTAGPGYDRMNLERNNYGK